MCISLPSNNKGYSFLHITSCQHGRLTPCTYSSIGNRVWHPGRAWLLHSLGNQTPIRVWLITQDGCDSPHPLTGCGLHVPLLGIGCRSPTSHEDVADHPIRVVAPPHTGCGCCIYLGAHLPFSGLSKLPFSGYQPSSGLFPTALFRVTSPLQGFSQLPFSGLFPTALIRETALFRVNAHIRVNSPL